MRILWITNSVMPEIAQTLGWSRLGSGGWMSAMLSQLRQRPNVKIVIATISKKINRLIVRDVNGVRYWILPAKTPIWKYDSDLEKYWITLKETYSPDIVHIHGTEFSHGLAYIKACGADNVIVSLQGLIGEIGKVYTAGISKKDVLKTETLSDKILKKGIRHTQQQYLLRGEYEKEYLKSVKYVIGRTDWDRMMVLKVNPQLKYYKNNESLGDIFYSSSWDYSKCIPYSIMVSQCALPIKGFHVLLRAMPLVLAEFPDAHIYVAGGNTVFPTSINERLLDTGYNVYLRQLIRENELGDKITFIGPLSSEEMCDVYQKSNVFVLCSAIENSSNSLAEAQCIGLPTIATSAAGTPTMTQHGMLSVQYDFEDYRQLAENIKSIFSLQYDVNRFSKTRAIAHARHNRKRNVVELMQIYDEVIKNDN
ncbi:MAG: glycosyltransferase [Paludibacteraceae bacterium]|nr:glycosyltransferase [Paludibacteraceae bacterium]